MSKIQRLFNILLIAFCGGWLLYKPLAGPILILLILLSTIGLLKKENRFHLQKNGILWLGFFVIYGISLLWSAHPDFSALERKLALLAFPLLFAFKWKNPLPIAQMWLSHTLACLILIVIAYCDALLCQMTLGNSVRCFSTTYFSQVHHPSYFSAFLLFGIIGLLFGKIAWFRSKKRWVSWLLIGLFSAIHLHLGSLAGMLGLAVVLMLYTSWQLSKRFGWFSSILIGFAAFNIGLVAALQHPEIKADAQNALHFTQQYLTNPEAFVKGRMEPLQGNEVRLILWTASAQIGIEHPFGLGLGGLESKLGKKLTNWGYPEQAKKEFNPHNQWLQIWNELGWIGLILFALIIGTTCLKFYKSRNMSALLLVAVLLIFCLFESVLQRESGIVFFLCWLSALTSLTQSKTA